MHTWAVSAFLFIALCSCASVRDVPLPSLAVRGTALEDSREGQPIELDGWIEDRGELLLFDSREAAKAGLVYPYCISAQFNSSSGNALPKLDGKKVRATGVLLRYGRPAPSSSSVATIAVIDGMPFKNWCFDLTC